MKRILKMFGVVGPGLQASYLWSYIKEITLFLHFVFDISTKLHSEIYLFLFFTCCSCCSIEEHKYFDLFLWIVQMQSSKLLWAQPCAAFCDTSFLIFFYTLRSFSTNNTSWLPEQNCKVWSASSDPIYFVLCPPEWCALVVSNHK